MQVTHIQHHYLLNSLANKTSIKNPNHILKSYEDPFKETLILYDEILKDYLDIKKYYFSDWTNTKNYKSTPLLL